MTRTNVNYTIIDKQGNVVEDVTFDNYERLADHMLELAEKWHSGGYDEGDQLKISTFDETGNLVYSDTATFRDTRDASIEIPESFNFAPESESIISEGFGGTSD